MSLRAVASTSIALGLVLSSATAMADLPPPQGQKFVPFYATVSGLDADHVLLVYPWSLSNGAPTEEIGRLAEGEKLAFGRRIMGEPKIYAMKKADWEAKKAEITSLPTAGALDCGATIPVRHLMDAGGPDELVVAYRVAELSDGACRLESSDGKGATPAAPADGEADEASVTPSNAVPAPPSGGETPSAGGCAACHVAPVGRSSGAWWLLGVGALVWWRRRARI